MSILGYYALNLCK